MFFFAAITISSCTEIYSPDVNTDKQALVVQGLITNEDDAFYIRLSQANLFNSDEETTYISDAILSVSTSNNDSYTLSNNGNGYYYLPSNFKSAIGETYTLHIETSDGSIYESDPQKLLPPLSFDSIYGEKTYSEFIGDDNVLNTVNGTTIYVDLFKNMNISQPDSFPICRFKTQITFQYEYWIDIPTDPFYTVYKSWRTYSPNEYENITEDNSNKSDPYTQHHGVCVVPIGFDGYGFSKPDGYVTSIYYLRIKQYTLNKDTYDFYTEANKQTSTDGKLFDPIATQLEGNIHCVNDDSKIALGFFEVSSVTKTAFRIFHYVSNSYVRVMAAPYINISNGSIHYKEIKEGMTPSDPDYIDITPSWWSHY